MSPRVMPENRIADILRAAASVFSRKGYRLTQMEEIAKEADVSKATLYYYFKGKNDLFYYLLENGVPEDGTVVAPPEDSPRLNEKELLELLRERLKAISRLKSIDAFLKDEPREIDLETEIGLIFGELWELFESNRVQIVILEKSVFEFPELAQAYDEYARQRVMHQLEEYLKSRIRLGAIRRQTSVPVTVRLIIESLSVFGWKQFGDPYSPVRYAKSEALPELVSIFSNGLKR